MRIVLVIAQCALSPFYGKRVVAKKVVYAAQSGTGFNKFGEVTVNSR